MGSAATAAPRVAQLVDSNTGHDSGSTVYTIICDLLPRTHARTRNYTHLCCSHIHQPRSRLQGWYVITQDYTLARAASREAVMPGVVNNMFILCCLSTLEGDEKNYVAVVWTWPGVRKLLNYMVSDGKMHWFLALLRRKPSRTIFVIRRIIS